MYKSGWTLKVNNVFSPLFFPTYSNALSNNMCVNVQRKKWQYIYNFFFEFALVQVYKRAKALDQSDNDISAVYRAYIH